MDNGQYEQPVELPMIDAEKPIAFGELETIMIINKLTHKQKWKLKKVARWTQGHFHLENWRYAKNISHFYLSLMKCGLYKPIGEKKSLLIPAKVIVDELKEVTQLQVMGFTKEVYYFNWFAKPNYGPKKKWSLASMHGLYKLR